MRRTLSIYASVYKQYWSRNLRLSRAYFPHLLHCVSLSNVDEGEKSLQPPSATFKINLEVAATLGVLCLCAIAEVRPES